jgi:hypothetical protein
MQRPEASYTSTFLIAIALQLGLIVLKRFVPADQLPRIQYLFEMLADGVTVLLFALGVFGGIASMPREL